MPGSRPMTDALAAELHELELGVRVPEREERRSRRAPPRASSRARRGRGRAARMPRPNHCPSGGPCADRACLADQLDLAAGKHPDTRGRGRAPRPGYASESRNRGPVAPPQFSSSPIKSPSGSASGISSRASRLFPRKRSTAIPSGSSTRTTRPAWLPASGADISASGSPSGAEAASAPVICAGIARLAPRTRSRLAPSARLPAGFRSRPGDPASARRPTARWSSPPARGPAPTEPPGASRIPILSPSSTPMSAGNACWAPCIVDAAPAARTRRRTSRPRVPGSPEGPGLPTRREPPSCGSPRSGCIARSSPSSSVCTSVHAGVLGLRSSLQPNGWTKPARVAPTPVPAGDGGAAAMRRSLATARRSRDRQRAAPTSRGGPRTPRSPLGKLGNDRLERRVCPRRGSALGDARGPPDTASRRGPR